MILYEASSGIRQIFTDGRPLPERRSAALVYGYSTGKWEGDTLVVETNNMRDNGWLDIIGTPVHRAGEDHRTFPPRELRPHGDRHHGRRSEGVHQAMDRARTQASCRTGDDRVHLRGEQQVSAAVTSASRQSAVGSRQSTVSGW